MTGFFLLSNRCSVCLKTFARKEHLDNHFRSHSGESPFRCQVGQTFSIQKPRHFLKDSPSLVDMSFRTFGCAVLSNMEISNFKFQFCAKTFTRKEHMQNHERKHTSTAPRCDICNKSFTRKEHYINNSLWHNGTTPHQCSICNKKYTRKEHLANHMRSHTLVSSLF